MFTPDERRRVASGLRREANHALDQFCTALALHQLYLADIGRETFITAFLAAVFMELVQDATPEQLAVLRDIPLLRATVLTVEEHPDRQEAVAALRGWLDTHRATPTTTLPPMETLDYGA